MTNKECIETLVVLGLLEDKYNEIEKSSVSFEKLISVGINGNKKLLDSCMLICYGLISHQRCENEIRLLYDKIIRMIEMYKKYRDGNIYILLDMIAYHSFDKFEELDHFLNILKVLKVNQYNKLKFNINGEECRFVNNGNCFFDIIDEKGRIIENKVYIMVVKGDNIEYYKDISVMEKYAIVDKEMETSDYVVYFEYDM